MTREAAQNADLDFDKMMGELAAMKTDLANRKASRSDRSGSRPATSRTATAEGEPRRTRLRRAATEGQADQTSSIETASATQTHNAVATDAVLSASAVKSSAALAASLRESNRGGGQRQELDQSQAQSLGQESEQQSTTSRARIRAAAGNLSLASAEPTSTTTAISTSEQPSAGSTEPDNASASGNSTRMESRRNPTVAPLPPKSAQRSRSISNKSSRLSQLQYSEHNELNYDQAQGNGIESHSGSPEGLSTPTFGPPSSSRLFLRPHPPPSPGLPNSTNGQSSLPSPRLPTRSNSRSHASKSSAPSSPANPDQAPMNPAPPTRSRSESRPISRTIRPDAGQEYNGQYPSYGTPTITEDQEAVPQQRQGADVRKKSSASNLQRQNAGEDSTMAPSLLPAETRRMPADYSSFQDQEQRPTIRKQMSADPAAMYRQHQQQGSSMPTRDRLPSRHASERRPSRDHNQSSGGNSPYLDSSRDDDNRFRADRQQGDTRGRSQTLDEDSTRNGFASSWAKSRSKSKDPSSSRQTPENPSYPEYNPALIPTRNTSSAGHQRAKSVPRKPSNQNLSSSDNWTPLPMQQQPAHGQSMPKPGLTLPPFGSSSKSGDTSTSHHGSSLNANTNANTTYHEKMIRGMGMGSTPIAPTVLLTPQPSFPTTSTAGTSPNGVAPPAAGSGGMRNIALAMMKQGGAPSSSEVQLQQRQQQLQQVQMQHLQQQQQRLAASVASSASPPDTPTSPRNQTSVSQASLPPPAGAAAGSSGATATPAIQRLVATRIYIQTETDFKSISLAPNTTALDVLHMLQQRGAFGEPGEGRYHDRWTVFEYTKEFLIERPLRDFEVVLDVMKTWDAEKDNKMICKSFPARTELSAKEVLRLVGPAGQQSFVRPHGWVHLETKKSKWVRRYMHITDTAVYHSKDPKPNGESMLCLLRNFDVYAVQVPRKKAPTKFGFALKSSDSVHMFETPEDDYIHYICVESGESLREWLAGLRAAKGMLMYHTNPELVREGQRRANELVGSNDLSEEQMSLAEAKLAGLGMSMSGNSRLR